MKGEHKPQFAYETHTACDCNGFVLKTVITPQNVHDSAEFDDVYGNIVERFSEMETVVAVVAYMPPTSARRSLRMDEFFPQRTSARRP